MSGTLRVQAPGRTPSQRRHLMGLTSDDRNAIQDLLARYCWHFDEGQGDAWADLWTPDGAFTGIPDPAHGREALRRLPAGFHEMFAGRMRHQIVNIAADAGPAANQAEVRAYSLLSDWRESGKLFAFAKLAMRLKRESGNWKIQSLHAEMF
jgi:hypothetical protein